MIACSVKGCSGHIGRCDVCGGFSCSVCEPNAHMHPGHTLSVFDKNGKCRPDWKEVHDAQERAKLSKVIA